MMTYVMIVITYLGGSAWGPQVSMQEFSSLEKCEEAKKEIMQAIDGMNQSNLTFGTPRRELMRAICQPK